MLKRTIYEQEHEMFRRTVRAWAEREVFPNSEAWREAGCVSREVWKSAGAQGLLCMYAGEKYGGLGLQDFRYDMILNEEIGAREPGFLLGLHNRIAGPYMQHVATDEQQDRYMPGIVAGDIILAIAMTEPGAGSDLAGIRTRAVDMGDHWVLNGSKTVRNHARDHRPGSRAGRPPAELTTGRGAEKFLPPRLKLGPATPRALCGEPCVGAHMSTKPPSPQDLELVDRERLRACLNSSAWKERVEEAARKRALVKAARKPPRDAASPEPGDGEYAPTGNAAREPGLGRRKRGGTHGRKAPHNAAPHPIKASEPVPLSLAATGADAEASVAAGRVAPGVLRSIVGWFAGVAAGSAACVLAAVVVHGALVVRTELQPMATAAPDVTVYLTNIEWTAAWPAQDLPTVPATLSSAGASRIERHTARSTAAAAAPPMPLPDTLLAAPTPAGDAIAGRAIAPMPALTPQPMAAPVEPAETRFAAVIVPEFARRPALRHLAGEPVSDLNAEVARPETSPFLVGMPELAETDAVAVAGIALPSREAAPEEIAVMAALPAAVGQEAAPQASPNAPNMAEPPERSPVLAFPSPTSASPRVAPRASDPPTRLVLPGQLPAGAGSLEHAFRTDPSITAAPTVMASFRGPLDPPSTVLAVSTYSAPDGLANPPGELVALLAPRADRAQPARWTEPAAIVQGPVRAILTHSGDEGAYVTRLSRLGVEVSKVQLTRFSVPVTRVHFFYGEDAGPARQLATELGGEAIDLAGFAPSPPRGTFEIQMAK